MTERFAPANDRVLFVLLKLVFRGLHSGTVWVDVASLSVGSGVENYNTIQGKIFEAALYNVTPQQ